MAPRWIEVLASGPENKKDGAAEILIDAGSPGLLEPDPQEVRKTFPEQGTACLKAYLPSSLEDRIEGLKDRLKRLGWRAHTCACRDLDWREEWKKYIRPVRIKDRNVKGSLLVRPPWLKAEDRACDTVIEIEPGMAFGTGEHPTTGMCLRAILVLVRGGGGIEEMLDLGTGSGVLAVAASRLGVKRVLATDTDPVALKAARANVRRNRAKVRVTGTPVERIKKSFQLVAANLTSEELKRLAPHLSKRVRPRGFLILSGILKEEASGVKDTYRSYGFKTFRTYRSGDWVSMVFTKAAGSVKPRPAGGASHHQGVPPPETPERPSPAQGEG